MALHARQARFCYQLRAFDLVSAVFYFLSSAFRMFLNLVQCCCAGAPNGSPLSHLRPCPQGCAAVPAEKKDLQALQLLRCSWNIFVFHRSFTLSVPRDPRCFLDCLDRFLQSAAHNQWHIQVCDGRDDSLVRLHLRRVLETLKRPAPNGAGCEGGYSQIQARVLC